MYLKMETCKSFFKFLQGYPPQTFPAAVLPSEGGHPLDMRGACLMIDIWELINIQGTAGITEERFH